MASAAPDNIKQWKFPKAEFIQNLSGHDSILNALASNSDNVLVSGADNGSIYMWDWLTGYNFQRLQSAAQPGSIDSEMGIFAMTFDQSGSRLLTCEADKTIKIYKEDENAVRIFRFKIVRFINWEFKKLFNLIDRRDSPGSVETRHLKAKEILGRKSFPLFLISILLCKYNTKKQQREISA